MNDAKRDAKLYVLSGMFEGFPVKELRRKAAGKVAGYGKMRKPELVRALAEQRLREEEQEAAEKALEETIAAQSAAYDEPEETKVRKGDGSKVRKGYCEVCSKRRIDRKTAGRDSTMCGPCFDYAGEENTHTDEAHETTGKRDDCAVCQGNDPAKVDLKPSKAKAKNGNGKPKAAPKNTKTTKGERFMADAKSAGWRAHREMGEEGRLEIVTVTHPNTGEWIRIQWRDGTCLNTGTTHKRPDGKVVKVRNASAARQLLDAA